MAVDVRQIIAQIMEDPRVKNSERFEGGRFASRAYDDEPILKTGSQMANYLPSSYRAARDIARVPGGGRRSEAWLFCEQGRALADVEDDLPFNGTFSCYFPTYQSMNDRQLRGYVTWRTAVRRGEVGPAPTSFMFVYVYELLNLIGVASPVEAFAVLRSFWEKARVLDATLDRYMGAWLVDLVVYHGLDPALVTADERLGAGCAYDCNLLVVLGSESGAYTDEELFCAYADLSMYRIAAGRFCKAYPQDTRAVALAVLRRLEGYYSSSRKYGLHEVLFGDKVALPYAMFNAAVFYEAVRHADVAYEFDPIRRFTCTNGSWRCERFPGGSTRNAKLGDIMRYVDARLRVRYGFAHLLKDQSVPKYLQRIVDQEIDRWLAWKEAHAPRVIEIDRSKLGGIRTMAAATCEELLIDEERADGLAARAEEGPAVEPAVTPAGEKPPAPPVDSVADGPAACAASAAPAPGAACGLTGPQAALVARLLAGEPYADVPAGVSMSLEMLVDGINEALFDLLGDTALEFDGTCAVLIEDYREDVREALQL